MGRDGHAWPRRPRRIAPTDEPGDHDRTAGPTLPEAPEGRELIAVLDTGGISALTPTSGRGRARLRALRAVVDDLVVPAAVLAEGVVSGHPGRDHHVRRLLGLVAIHPIDADLGLAAGALRVRAQRDVADPPPSGVDALVVAVADARALTDDVVIITSDVDDLTRLATHAHHADRLIVHPA